MLSGLVYLPSWKGEFLWDDINALPASEIVQDPSGWLKAWVAPPRSHPDYFPLTTNTFWLEWRLFGENPFGYRVVNTLLHGLAAVALYSLLIQLGLPGAAWAAAIFALHPVNVESVAWISERKNVLSMLFGILSFAWFMRWQGNRSAGSYQASLLIFVAALASKASVVALPLVFLAFLWWRDRRLDRRDIRGVVPFVLTSLFFGLMVVHFQHSRAVGQWDIEMPGWLSRIGGAGVVYWHYVFSTFWPVNLMTIYPRSLSDPAQAWQVALSLGTVICGSLALFSKNIAVRTVGFAMVATALLLAPVLGFVKMSFMRYALVSDHLQQVALPVLISSAICGVAALVRDRKATNPMQRAWIGLPIAASLCLFVLSWHRAGLHASNEAMWRDSLAKNPNSSHAHNFLGSILAARKNFSDAERHFLEAARLDPGNPEPPTNYAFTLMDRGRDAEAIQAFQKVVESGTPYAGAFLGLSEAYTKTLNMMKATEVLVDGARRFPDSMTLNASAAGSLLAAGNPSEALGFLEQCRRLDPDNRSLQTDIAETRRRADQVQGEGSP